MQLNFKLGDYKTITYVNNLKQMQLLTYIVYFDMFSSYDSFDNTCHNFL
jgi:hypothetical protein